MGTFDTNMKIYKRKGNKSWNEVTRTADNNSINIRENGRQRWWKIRIHGSSPRANLKHKTKQELITTGNLNGRTGRRGYNQIVGKFSEVTINANGERLICESNNLRKCVIVHINTTITVQDVRVGTKCTSNRKIRVARMYFHLIRKQRRNQRRTYQAIKPK